MEISNFVELKNQESMWIILSLLIAGIAIGYGGRKSSVLRYFSEKVSWTVLLLLFVFGISIGSDEAIMRDLGSLGLTALLFAAATIAGSLAFVWVIVRITRKNKKRARE